MDQVRLDVWLDVSCLFHTRSEAKRACEGGKVDVNDQSAKPHRLVHVGDRLRITRSFGRRQVVEITGLADRSVPKAVARTLYDDHTPLPSPEEIEARRSERLFRRMNPVPRTPDKRDRRALRRLKGR